MLESTATLVDRVLAGDSDGLASTDADHFALVDDRVLRRLRDRDTIFRDRDEDQDLVGDFDAKVIDDKLVALLAAQQNGS